MSNQKTSFRKIVYTNGLGKTINITSVNITGDSECSSTTVYTIPNGKSETLSVSGCTTTKSVGDIASLNVAISYIDLDSGLTHPLSGQINVRLQ